MGAGTAGDTANRAVAQELLASPDWGLLAVPLIRAVQNIVHLASVMKGSFPHHAVHADHDLSMLPEGLCACSLCLLTVHVGCACLCMLAVHVLCVC